MMQDWEGEEVRRLYLRACDLRAKEELSSDGLTTSEHIELAKLYLALLERGLELP